jgi:hypothetical protein
LTTRSLNKRRFIPALLLIAAGLVLVAVGMSRGEAGTVLARAIRICLECIGIG